MVVKYDVVVQPIKFACSAVKRGGTYVIGYERKSSAEFVSAPVVCSRDGEVTYHNPSDPIVVPSFIVNFESQKDKKLLLCTLYDFSKRPKIERVLDFEVALGEHVNAMAGQSFCAIRDFPFRSGKFSGKLRVLLRMFPVGTPMPTLAPTEPTAVLKGDVMQVLRREKLIPASIDEIEADADVLEELAAKVQLFERSVQTRSTMSESTQQLLARRTELESVLADVEASLKADGGRSQVDSADRHMLDLLDAEEQRWNSLCPSVQSVVPSVSTKTDAMRATEGGPDMALLSELTEQRRQLQKYLANLEKQQSTRDVTTEAIEAIESLKHLDALIEETKSASGAMKQTKKNNSSQAALTQSNQDGDTETPAGLARRLLHHYAITEAAEYAARLLDQVKHRPYDGITAALEEHGRLQPGVPRELSCVLKNTRKPRAAPIQPPMVYSGKVVSAASSGVTAASTSAPRTQELLADLFNPNTNIRATAPPPSVVSRPTGVGAASQPPTSGSRPVHLDDLFAPPQLSTPQEAPRTTPPPPPPSRPQVTLPTATAASSSSATAATAAAAVGNLPQFEILSIPTTTNPMPLAKHTFIRIRTQAVKFVDYTGTKVLRGSELTIFNDNHTGTVSLSDFIAKQEDIFSSVETIIPTKSNTSVVRVRAGDVVKVYLSFPPQTSMVNAMMVNLQLRVVVEDTHSDGYVDSVRLTL